MKTIIATNAAPGAIGPYSQAVDTGNFIYTSGQLPIDPTTGLMPDNVSDQTRQSLNNIAAILKEGGMTMDNVVKTTVFLTDMDNFAAMNEVYNQFFSEPYPARSAVAVRQLPKDALVEIEAIAVR